MRTQTFTCPDSAAALPASLVVPVMPGEWCQVIGLCYLVVSGGGARYRPHVIFAESAQSIQFFVTGPLMTVAITNLLVCGLREVSGTTKDYINNALSDGTIEDTRAEDECNLCLAKYMFDRNFTVQFGQSSAGGGDLVKNVRCVVAFGSLEEINVL